MKKLLLGLGVVFALLSSSCISHSPAFERYIAYLDYSEYTADGFYISEAMNVPFEYTPVASLTVSEFPGWDKRSKSGSLYDNVAAKDADSYYDSNYNKWYWRAAAPDSALKGLVKTAKQTGANGIIGLKVTPVETNRGLHYVVSGMLIKKHS